jgi:asparagine synthase (glutamine-hydrolysing)
MNKYYFDEFEESELKKVLKFDLEFFLSGLLHVEDRMSMAHGLESRLPYLDHKLVEYQLSQDENTLFLDGELKYSFKKILKDNLPKKVFNREDKMGFPIPLNIWIKRKTKNGLREYVNDTFSSINFRNRPFYNKKNFTEILESTNKNIYNRAIWNFLSLELWYNKTN